MNNIGCCFSNVPHRLQRGLQMWLKEKSLPLQRSDGRAEVGQRDCKNDFEHTDSRLLSVIKIAVEKEKTFERVT